MIRNIFVLIVFIIQFSCTSKKNNTKTENLRSFDGIENIPEWLKLNVEEALPFDGLNIWIPTNNFQTSSLVRVPRFPRKFSESEINNNEALNFFEIITLPPDKVLNLTAVRNEQVSAQIALGAKIDLSNVSVNINKLVSLNGENLNSKNIQIRFVKYVPVHRARSEYVWSPKLESIIGEGVSGTMDPNVVADPLIEIESVNVPAYRAQPVWLTFKIPKGTHPGVYEGNISIHSDEYGLISHKLKLQVLEQELPDPKDYKFHLDLWLNPSAIAEYYGLEHWSQAHWDMILKYLTDYASGGGKNITTTITHEPWHKPWLNGTTRSQIAFGYRSMIDWIKNEDGSWSFDYSVFDKYVDMATKVGIDEAINAF
ncbi:MAG: hypothetical protein JKX79_10790 [Labilibaculum sp.]|nr:hypothetical protein [Labilibaculum sp.]